MSKKKSTDCMVVPANPTVLLLWSFAGEEGWALIDLMF